MLTPADGNARRPAPIDSPTLSTARKITAQEVVGAYEIKRHAGPGKACGKLVVYPNFTFSFEAEYGVVPGVGSSFRGDWKLTEAGFMAERNMKPQHGIAFMVLSMNLRDVSPSALTRGGVQLFVSTDEGWVELTAVKNLA